ncbi:hypothetical protein WMF27_40265 [Sorangium sp. So ce281]|uniref:hypothetical protein n=1 Tax=unclassified Sorangium TaxID=2621164 RepID=UPI003F5FEE45
MARDATNASGTTPADPPEMTHGGLTIERYGEISAHLRRFPRSAKAEVLARLNVADADWDAAVCGWTDALADESADSGEALSNRFCRAFAGAEARLQREQPALASLGALPAAIPPALAAVPPGMRHFTSLRETVEASADALRRPALPFAHRAPGGPGEGDARATSLADRARSSTSPARAAAPPGGETADLSTAVASALGQQNPLPFPRAPAGAAPPAAVPSLQRHAAMCAEIAIAPDKAAEILARYGLTEATRAQADEHWRARIAAEAATGEAWRRAYMLHRDWLLGRSS